MTEPDATSAPATDSMTVPARPRALVLLATFNGGRWIRHQLSSVLAQKGVNVQIDVRDDGSTDDTRAIVADIATRDSRVRLSPEHISSGSAAGNFFRLVANADVSGVDVVAFCDQDDEWMDDKLARAVSCLIEQGADGYSAAVQAKWESGRVKALSQRSDQRSADYLFEGAGQGCTFVMTAALFTTVQGALSFASGRLPSVHYHDWLAYAIARSLGRSWHFDPRAVMTYHQHAGNDTGARGSMAGVARRLDLIRSGWYERQVDAVVAVVRHVNPSDPNASRWHELRSKTTPAGWASRLVFVLRHGRRRLSDRVILGLAVLTGHL